MSGESERVLVAGGARFRVRTGMKPGDLGTVVFLHGMLYAEEHGFDHTFEPYVAEPMARFALRGCDRDRIWIVEREGRTEGAIAIVGHSEESAQLRWFLLRPDARGLGLGKRLARRAVEFAREKKYGSVFLWTLDILPAAGRIYRCLGFERTRRKPGRVWGVDLVEEKYVLALGSGNEEA